MASINKASRIDASPITTFEGEHAKRLSDVQALERAVYSCLLWEDSFYEDGVLIADRIKSLTLAVPPNEAAKIAIKARTTYKIRHAPLWIARWLASGDGSQRRMARWLLPQIIQRPDELTEFMALYWKDGKTPIAACVKRGLAEAFTKFNEYQLAKYNNQDKAIKLRDVLFLCHAKPKDDAQAALWKRLIDGKMATPDTWETELSAGKDKGATFTRLIAEGKLGALAMLRNLRNMQEAKVEPDMIRTGIALMKTERVLPFRFISAAKYAPQYESLLEVKMIECLSGSEKLRGKTALVIDVSGSMWETDVSARSELSRFDAAAALAILAREVCEDVNIYSFAEEATRVPARRGFALRDALAALEGGASFGGKAVSMANDDGYDRIIVITDGQWHTRNDMYLSPAHEASPAPLTDKAYLINVAPYQNAVGSGKWTMIDGWSESIIQYIQAVEGIAE